MAQKQKPETILTPHQKEVLDRVSSEDYFASRYYLAGGTALAEFYLKHRLSEDLDFFTEKQEVNFPLVAKFFENKAGVLKIKKIETKKVFGLYSLFITFTDNEKLKVDFNYYPFPRINKGLRYKKLAIEDIYDIGVDKVHTVVMKPRARDFIDIYFTIREERYDFEKLILDAKAKFDWDISAIELGARFSEAAKSSDFPRMLKKIDHAEWKNFFVDEARKLKSKIFKK
ncbi:MAG: nucleotidyl transferase AbiEii/AbiGii toxin family protein [Candidatus Liptonbacteria bacterium]|nr:nucleotidyl transferase AbiEii/AbiGii toxin family protein [Candidatus Liptonbacteria bacterium]